MNKKAFSLVELIIVIAIVAILWTIATFTLSKWLGHNRDAKRAADLNLIMWALETYKFQNQSYPFPDDYTLITYGWDTVWYQWYLGSTVIKKLEIKNEPKDPLDDSYYTYSVDEWKDKFQIWTLLEKTKESTYSNNVKAAEEVNDYSERFIKVQWDKVWVLFSIENTPAQEIFTGWNPLELQSLADNYRLYFTDSEYLTWNGETIFSHMNIYRDTLDSLNTDLAYHLSFDKGYGYTAYDGSMNAFNWSLNNGAEWIEWLLGKGVYFDGVDNSVTISDPGNSSALDPDDIISLSIRINPMALPSAEASIIDKGTYWVSLLPDSTVKIYAAASSYNISSSININRWTHVAFTYEKAVNELKLYIDWEFIDELWVNSGMPWNNDDVIIGGSEFKWIMDEIAVFNDNLTAEEIKSLYNVHK